MDEIYNLLNNYLKSSKNGVNEIIAQYMLVSLNRVPHMRATDIAAACHTSASSVVRFCRELGYGGYIEFKDVVDDYFQNVRDKYLVPHVPLKVLGSDDEYEATLKTWTQLMQEYALCAMLALDRDQIMRLAQDILQYKYVCVFGAGFSAQIANQLRIRLARSGKIILTMEPPDLDMPLTASRGDALAIVISQHGRAISLGDDGQSVFSYFQKHCAKTWLITQLRQKTFQADEVVRIISGNDFEVDFHTMIYFEELLGEYCRALLEENRKKALLQILKFQNLQFFAGKDIIC